MSVLSPAQLLDAWERALPLPPDGRPLALLAAASAVDGTRTALAALPLGVRDAQLLDLLAATFGPRLDAAATCPACAEALEFSCTVDQVRAGPPSGSDTVEVDGYRLRVRPPDSDDLAAVAVPGDPAAARLDLLRRCVTVLAGPAELSERAVAAVEEAMLALDPQAEVLVTVDCGQCGYRWCSVLDVGAFLWARVDGYARRCAAEVHALARAYGWREADILAMSPWRRALYLDLVAP